MFARCYNKNDDMYYRYGGRGISICDQWHEFIPFKDWAFDNGYDKELTIDRIDNDGIYSPDNCRWVTPKVNTRNSTVAKLTIDRVAEIKLRLKNGENKHSIAADYDVSHHAIYDIIRNKTWTDVEPLIVPYG